MITIQHLLHLGILNESNYEYTYADEYNKVIDFAYKDNEVDELNKRLIVLSVIHNSGKFVLNIKPDDYLIRRYEQSKETEMMKAVGTIRKMCNEIPNCKLCPYYTEVKPNGSLSDNCKLAKTAPFNW